MKKIFKYALWFISVLLINSCQKPNEIGNDRSVVAARQSTENQKTDTDLSVKGDYEVRNGMLFFRDVTTFLALDKELRAEAPDKRVEFTKQIGFSSLLNAQLNAYESFSEVKNQEEYDKILSSNSNIIRLKDGYLTSVFEEVSAALINTEGMVNIGGNIHCFVKGKTIVSSEVDQVRETYKTGIKKSQKVIIIENKSNYGARLKAACSAFDKTAYSDDNNREVRCTVNIMTRQIVTNSDPNDTRYTIEFYTYVGGTPRKKNFFGSWVNYSTSNTLYNRFSGYISVVRLDPTGLTFYDNYFINENSTKSINGSYIDYAPIIATYNNIPKAHVDLGFYAITSKSLEETNPLGLYTSGGVPNGVQMKCP